MQGARQRNPRRRRRRGSIASPIDVRLVRTSMLVVAVAAAIVAVTTAQGDPIAAPALKASFDGAAAVALTGELVGRFPNRLPGSPYDAAAADWVSATLGDSGLKTTTDRWSETVPGLGKIELRNVALVIPGTAPDAIVVAAHRDNSGTGGGANDNASGTATLIQLARDYATAGTTAARPRPLHTLVFLSTDAGAYGSVGARRFVNTYRGAVLAAIVLDGLAGHGEPRLDIAGDGGRVASPAFIRTAVARIGEQVGRPPGRPSVLRQLVDLGVPYGYGDQAPFLGAHVSAVRITTVDDSGRSDPLDGMNRISRARLAQLGAAAQNLLGSLDARLELAQGSSAKIVIGNRVIRGWALELALVSALIPFAAGVIDLVARCRRLGIPLAPAFRSLRRRLGYAAWLALVVWLVAAAGLLPTGGGRPLPPAGREATSWHVGGVAVVFVLGAVGWFITRRRLVPERPATAAEDLAGYAGALTGLGIVAMLTAVLQPLSLLFVVPSVYTWLWLPLDLSRWRRDILLGGGFAGAVLVLASFWGRYDLGLRTPLYLVELVTTGYVPWRSALLALAWLAVANQLAALTVGRYGPYAGGAAEPPRGAIRDSVRRAILAAQARRR